MAMNPLKQFEVVPLLPLEVAGVDLTITNHTLWVWIATALIATIFALGSRNLQRVPNRFQGFIEITVDFVRDMTTNTAGAKAVRYLPLILTTFLFIAAMNLVGMVPGSFTATSQIYTTLGMATLVFLFVVGVGIKEKKLKFFAHFFPKGTPLALAPLIIPLELISFLARPFTLAIRLAANMVAGHVLVKLFATFVVMLMGWFAVSAAAPMFFLICLTALEIFVALLQAYIFTVLTCVYLADALHTEDH